VAVRELGSLDPAKASWRGASAIQAQIFDALTGLDPATGRVAPAAATSWSVSPDGLTWTFRLRPGAKYHDGAPVLAKDFKAAFDRLARKSTGADVAFQLEEIDGFREAHELGTADALAGVAAVDNATLRIRLREPFAELPYALSHPRLGPLQQRRYARALTRLDTVPIGNGPFKVTGVREGTELRLGRFDAYAGGGPAPKIDELLFRALPSLEEGWRELLDGNIDIADVPPSAGSAATGREATVPVWATLAFGPNLRLEKYATQAARRGLALAIDRETIASTVYNGTKRPATGILPPGVRAARPDLCDVCRLDREGAKRLLGIAYGGRMPEITIDHLNDPSSRQLAAAVAADLGAVGISTKMRAHTRKEYVSFLQAGKQDFAQLGWLADVPTPDGFLAEQLRTGSPNNQIGFSDARFDTLIKVARKEQDEKLRMARYAAAEVRALELMPLIPVVFFQNRVGIGARVRGLEIDGAGVFDASTVWLEGGAP